MGGRRILVFAFLTFVFVFGFSTSWRMQAQDNSAPSTMVSIDPYLMDRDAEIAMARSAAGDDHISKSTFKSQCWDTQVDFIEHFDLERINIGADDAFVKYLCHTKNGKAFRNVEYLRITRGKLESIECYFGAQSSFPSAGSTGQK